MSQTAVVDADHFQFIINDTEGAELEVPHPPSGVLVEAQPEQLMVITGVQYGGISVTAEHHPSRPPLSGTWDDVVEVSVVAQNGLCVSELMAEPDVVRIVSTGGPVRLRICARGRDVGASWFDGSGGPEGIDEEEVVEFYLIQAWLEPSTPPTVVKLTSNRALTWYSE